MKINKLNEVTEKSADTEKQKLWERFYTQYENVIDKLRNVVNDLKSNVEEKRAYIQGKEYLDKLTNYYKTIEKLVMHPGNYAEEVKESVQECEKLLRAVSNYVNRYTQDTTADAEQKPETAQPTVDTSTLQKFVTLTKRLNKQLFFKDSNGNLKRVAPSKYDSIKPEQLANVFVTKTGKEEMSLASIIPQLKQDNLIEQIENLYNEDTDMNNLFEDRKDEQPSDIITTRRYRPIPLSYRDRLKELGFESAGRVAKWFKEYKGYCITVIERTNRQKLVVFLSEGSVLKIDPTRGKKLVAEEVYTEEQLVSKIKELESKIDTFRKDPYDRDEESIYEQMNRIDDDDSLTEGVSNTTKIINYTKNNLDRFNEYDSYEDWLDELNIAGVFDIPAKYCDDFENVTDEEAEAYIKMILSQGKLKQQLDDLKQ